MADKLIKVKRDSYLKVLDTLFKVNQRISVMTKIICTRDCLHKTNVNNCGLSEIIFSDSGCNSYKRSRKEKLTGKTWEELHE